jgi:hypothetical protein
LILAHTIIEARESSPLITWQHWSSARINLTIKGSIRGMEPTSNIGRFTPKCSSCRAIIGILIFLILGLGFFIRNAFTLDEKPKPGKEEVKELILTPDQMKRYASTYKDPYVLHIRKMIDRYLTGKLEGYDNYKALKAVGEEYLENKFIVLSIENSLVGGKEISLISQKKPDKIFTAWVYLAGDVYELRAFDVQELTEEEIKNIKITFRRFLEDKNLAL